METGGGQPNDSGRLRLVDIRFGAGKSSLHFGGGLAGVITEPSERSAAAQQIAATVIGPRPREAAGSVDVAGRLVSIHSLPTVLLPPSAPAVLDRDDLTARWQAVCARRRGDLAATHASRRLERHRTEAAIERAGTREGASATAAIAARGARVPGGSEPLREQIRDLVVSIDALAPIPSAEAEALALDWEAHTELMVARAAAASDLQAAELRVDRALDSIARTSGIVASETRSEIDRCHRLVVQAEAALFEARRKGRAQAVARYEAAVAAENEVLSAAGVDSYAAFLVSLAGGGGYVDADTRHAAQRELAAAEAALDLARRTAVSLARVEVTERSIALRAHAERLLRRQVVGGDPPAELRALRVVPPAGVEKLRRLGELLSLGGIDVGGDVLEAARRVLAEPAPEAVAPSGVAENTGPAAESLERQREEHEQALAELEAEIARLDKIYDADVAGIAPADLAGVMESLLESYRAGNLLGGRLPVVLDGALDGLEPDARDAAVRVLAGATDVQSIVVTDDLDVMKSVTEAGGTVVLWSDAMAAEPGGSELQASRWTTA